MSLETLPEEILIIIIKQLDTISQFNLYNASSKPIKNILCMSGVIKQCNFSMNSLATVKSLNLDFVKDVSKNLQELNMSGVPNMTKTALISALNRMKNLKKLDVSYTNINILDLPDMYEVCSTIKNIAIDFHVPNTLPDETIEKFQKIFKNMDKVLFVGSLANLLFCSVPLIMLQGVHLDVIHFIVAKLDKNFPVFPNSAECEPLQFNHFCVCYLNWVFPSVYRQNPFSKFIFNYKFQYAFVVIAFELGSCRVICSEMFKEFFQEKFGFEADPESKFEPDIITHPVGKHTNLILMMWNMETTEFDNSFYRNLFLRVVGCFPCEEKQSESDLRNWFLIKEIEYEISDQPPELMSPPLFKKRRVALENVPLVFDDEFKEFKNVQLSFDFTSCQIHNPVSLPITSDYLRKVTYMSLTGFVRYTRGFFNVLFRNCNSLVTLNVEASPVSSCAPLISRSIPISRSLKNFRLVDKVIDYKTLFPSLSQCKQLENVHIQDVCIVTSGFMSPETIFENCRNLYYMSLRISLAVTAVKKVNAIVNKAKAKCGRSYLRFELYNNLTYKDVRYNYDPFLSVFKLNPIKQV